jgi:tetrahydromethanopterin S-methyltransferase subunit E
MYRSKNVGAGILFGGLVLLATWRMLVVAHIRGGANVFSLLFGVLFCALGIAIVKRKRAIAKRKQKI